MGKADLHMHSTYSDGCESVERIVTFVEQDTDLDVIAITDHDCLAGALQARDFAARQRGRLQVIPGAEISTRDGHLLALNIERLIPAGWSMADTAAAVREQGGVAIAAHPLSRWCPSVQRPVLDEISPLLDGLEAINGSFAGIGSNGYVHTVNQTAYRLAETGGSDAHTLSAIGCAYTTFPGHSAEDLIRALRARTTRAEGGLWPVTSFLQYGVVAVRHRIAPLRLPKPA